MRQRWKGGVAARARFWCRASSESRRSSVLTAGWLAASARTGSAFVGLGSGRKMRWPFCSSHRPGAAGKSSGSGSGSGSGSAGMKYRDPSDLATQRPAGPWSTSGASSRPIWIRPIWFQLGPSYRAAARTSITCSSWRFCRARGQGLAKASATPLLAETTVCTVRYRAKVPSLAGMMIPRQQK